jgi:hypothetical protein
MTVQAIFGLQFFLSLLVWGVIARILFMPWVKTKPLNEILIWLTLPHAFRHIGMVFLVPGVVAAPLPEGFAYAAAYGDLLAGLIALAAIVSLHAKWPGALALVWIFNIIGTVDLLNALRNPEPIPSMGATWYIPTFLVPLLLVSHFLIFKALLRKNSTHSSCDSTRERGAQA